MSLVEQIKSKGDIVNIVSEYITLTKRGKNYWGICPFHQDKNPSMSVSPEKQIFNCFSCNTSGNLISFISKYLNISYEKAKEFLCKKLDIKYINATKKIITNYTEKDQLLINLMNSAAKFYKNELNSETGKDALKYLISRKISHNDIDKFNIGFSNGKRLKEFLLKNFTESNLISSGFFTPDLVEFFKGRIIFPITNIVNDTIGASGRIFNDVNFENNKYINLSATKLFDKSAIFYNYHNAIDFARQHSEIIITEGFFDVISLSKSGFENTIAIMGTALTNKHLNLLRNLKVVLMFDPDKAGRDANLKSLENLLLNKFEVFVVNNNIHLDPDEIFQKFGSNKLAEIVNNRIDGFTFLLNFYKKTEKINDPNTLERLLLKLNKLIPRKSEILFKIHKEKVMKILNVSIEIINELLVYKKDKDFKINSKKYSYNNINNWSFSLIKTLMKSKEFSQLYLKIDPLITSNDKFIYNDIANKTLNNIPEYRNSSTAKYIKTIKSNIEIIQSKDVFFDIIDKISIDSLEKSKSAFVKKLKNEKYLNSKNYYKATDISKKIQLLNKKIKEIKENKRKYNEESNRR